MKVYKVVYPSISGKLYSLRYVDAGFTTTAKDYGVMEYSTEMPTTPKEGCGPLAAFSTLRLAVKFSRGYSSYRDAQVWEAAATPTIDRGRVLYTKVHSKCCLPKGTKLCDEIILRKLLGTVRELMT